MPAWDEGMSAALPGPGYPVHWCGLYGSAASLQLARLAAQAPGPLLLVAANQAAAGAYTDELGFYMAGLAGGAPLVFPDRQTLPYDSMSPSPELSSIRLGVLSTLPDLRRGIVVTSMAALAHRLAPPGAVCGHGLHMAPGTQLCVEDCCKQLSDWGYRAVSLVAEPGEYAVRGALLDIYPVGSSAPCRVDLLDECIESLRGFDPRTQRTTGALDGLDLLPAAEVAMTPANVERFRRGFRVAFPGAALRDPVYRQVGEGVTPAGIEYYLPLFYEHTVALTNYLPKTAAVVLDAAAWEALECLHADFERRHARAEENSRLPPRRLLHDAEELRALLARWPCIELGSDRKGAVRMGAKPLPVVGMDTRHASPSERLEAFLATYPGRVLLVAEGPGRVDTLRRILHQHRPSTVTGWHEFATGSARLALTAAPVERGLLLDGLCVLTEAELSPERVRTRRAPAAGATRAEDALRDLHEIDMGAPVVHVDHGVGRYRGLATLEPDDVPTECLCLEYAGGDRLYVPVAALDRVSRYSGADPEHAPLHRLGAAQWRRQRAGALRSMHDLAAEILDLDARRDVLQGHACELDADRYAAFCSGFPFTLTPDQEAAEQQVLEDLHVPRSMDRLVCGDAGFGKTEIALRAAFITVDNARQVVVLAPSLLLAEQHYRVFSDRFADWPVRIALMTRAGNDQVATARGLAAGTIDIVIGTHKLLHARMRCKRLGLLIIDEEQRFGVRQKERLKGLRAETDLLTLTATPIPRTLDAALAGLRDLSVIATPPPRRWPVLTQVREWDEDFLVEVIKRELHRGGQVFCVHDRIASIDSCAAKVHRLVPGARLRVAHGRMATAELEQIMLDFRHRRFDILVCTTIIENGLDIPNANTILIDRAHGLGLAQLYQLRGRVGRSHQQGYACLLIPPRAVLGEPALRRLRALEALDTLGVGFSLALHDLEIRGAGDLLGAEQSGHIRRIGYGTYLEMLRRTIVDLRAGRQPSSADAMQPELEIDLRLPALLPSTYVPDVHVRLSLYKRIAGMQTLEELQGIREELIDRFGALPAPADYLLRVSAFRQQARELCMARVRLCTTGGSIYFHEPGTGDAARLLQLVQEDPATFRPSPGNTLKIIADLPTPEVRLAFLQGLFERLLTRHAA